MSCRRLINKMTPMAAELTLYEALVEAGVSKERARDVVLAQAGTMHEFLSPLVTKSELAASTSRLQGEIAAVRGEIAAARNELRGEIGAVRGEIAAVRNELKGEISAVRNELKGEISAVRSELKGEVAAVRNELKGDIAEFRAYVDGRFNVVAEQFVLVHQDMNAMSNKIVVRLGALMVVLFGLAASLMRLPR